MRRLIALLVLLYVGGFGAFMLLLAKPLPVDRRTDAIVVVTGGAGRIDRGLYLLQAKAARRMLVSGVAQGVLPAELAHEYKVSAKLFDCCIDLGQEAVDTRSNGEETASWVRAHDYKTVRLVTSDWHMARAKMELEGALGSDAQIVGDGVPSRPRWQLLYLEYNKLLLRRVALWLGYDS
jgi:uncharacterized SAM-binding protein YcdF (DUF218 family)